MDTLQDITVAVPVDDLDIIRAALSSAYHHSMVLDLAEQYRKLSQRPQSSPLSKALQNSMTLLISYIEQATAEEEPDES